MGTDVVALPAAAANRIQSPAGTERSRCRVSNVANRGYRNRPHCRLPSRTPTLTRIGRTAGGQPYLELELACRLQGQLDTSRSLRSEPTSSEMDAWVKPGCLCH